MRKLLFLTISLAALSACGPDVEKLAQQYLDAASECYTEGNYEKAKLLIDSVKSEYPNALEARRNGIRLLQKVEMAEAERTILYQDSAAASMRRQFNDVKDGFVFEKDEKYQDLGLYTVASQSLENNIGRNYIRGQVDEKGRMTLVSNYSGSSYIHHRSLRLSCGDNFIDTPVSEDFYEFKDLGVCYEKCNFTDNEDGGAAAFITLNIGNDITVSMKGERVVEIKMTDSDKKAISELYSLSMLLKSINEAEWLRDEAARKLEFVKSNLSGNQNMPLK